uniref:Trafficking protein particle complex subunit n=1 Tax=Calcidiscus leptoporus TaxID=127549 RepID=A0A7S0P187_9EUKA|mmetsp:Transcript_48355/g.111956  ORF Transcript_48355/g.111956 Transcript_48355/m.111956 type:complete len:138 (+) Transcript_48355:52-465(+)
MVRLYTLHIFNRQGVCLYYQDWQRPRPPAGGDLAQEHKLMFGFLFSLKQLVGKMSPRKGGFYACSTAAYKLNYYETASGLRFVLCSEVGAGDMREVLRHVYANIYVECVTKNPLWKVDEPVNCPMFVQTLGQYLENL